MQKNCNFSIQNLLNISDAISWEFSHFVGKMRVFLKGMGKWEFLGVRGNFFLKWRKVEKIDFGGIFEMKSVRFQIYCVYLR